MSSFFLPKQASIVWSVHSDFQHSDGSGGVSPLVREKPPRISMVWFGSSCPSNRPTLTKPLTPSGPSNRPTLSKPLKPFSEKVGSRTLKELCEDQKTLSVPPENLTRGSRICYETLRALCKFRPSCEGGGSLALFPPEPRATRTKNPSGLRVSSVGRTPALLTRDSFPAFWFRTEIARCRKSSKPWLPTW